MASLPPSDLTAFERVDALARFHPVVAEWFRTTLGEPSEPQRQGWPLIRSGRDVLIAAPTGSGKTLAAFLACIDQLFRKSLEGPLPAETSVLYVSPLKALGNDVQRNLLAPLAQIEDLARARGLNPAPIRVEVRTGDTSAAERARMVRKPPHVLITTPESLFLYLTAGKARETLRTVRTVIVDEIHALARDKRGAHFALSLARLEHLLAARAQRIGLSATQRPVELFSALLTGAASRRCAVVEVGHVRPWNLAVEVPDDELTAVATHEMWGQIYDRIAALSREHRTVLVFANTRRLAERVAHDLGQRIGTAQVAAHHGSMARQMRLETERRLKHGELRVLVATSSLELGIDIGSVDLVCQLGSPRSIAGLLQRVGRAGHQLGGVSKGILFATTRDELVECAALMRGVRRGELDAVHPPEKPLDVLAQQIVAACAADDWNEDDLFRLVRRAWHYRELARGEFDAVLQTLSEGFALRRGHARALLHRDRVNGVLKARRGARLVALTNAGAIPDAFTYRVIAEPEEKPVGTVDEDWATESLAGDVFLLGSSTWRIRRISGDTVRVEDAQGQAPNVPFWRAEAPSRTDELSAQVSALRDEVARMEPGEAAQRLEREVGLGAAAAAALAAYVRTGAAQLGAVPGRGMVVAERFFDESGGMQLILHAPFGGRINRAWGLALRKRFCRIFDFELQAAATDDGLLLSLGEQHSFPLADVFEFLNPETCEEVLTQAVLQIPIFGTRFRWVATRALALERMSRGRRVPPHLQRARAEDLLAAVFPAQVGCQDNRAAEAIEVPDHPLVAEALRDCLRDAMDVDGLVEVLRGIREGRIATRAVDLPGPSVFAHQFLNSQPYTFLDDAPLEERRARAVSLRRTLAPQDAAAFGALDANAIASVVEELRPPLRHRDEVHDLLLQLGLAREEGLPSALVEELVAAGRAACLAVAGGARFVVARERLNAARAVHPFGRMEPELDPLSGDGPIARDDALRAMVQGRLEVSGPTSGAEIAADLVVDATEVEIALARLESEGVVLQGHFRPRADDPTANRQLLTANSPEWCERRILQRIHRRTLAKLRADIEPLSGRDFMRFLFHWHHLERGEGLQGRGGLEKAVALLQGFEAPASAWETTLLAARMRHYVPDLLELACWRGEIAWGRLTLRDVDTEPGPPRGAPVAVAPRRRPAMPGRNARITFARREDLPLLLAAARPAEAGAASELDGLSHPARELLAVLEQRGASFFFDLVSAVHRLPSELEDALWELVARGFVTGDAIENLRVLQLPPHARRRGGDRGGPGRWTLLRAPAAPDPAAVRERIARLMLERYGVVCRDVVAREPLAPPWWQLLAAYRRMEARGEIRGGRFLAGLAGEQFALPEAVEMARAVRRRPQDGARVLVATVDPLNLTGVIAGGPRIAAVPGQVIVYRDGVPEAVRRASVSPPRPWSRGPTLPAAPGAGPADAREQVAEEAHEPLRH